MKTYLNINKLRLRLSMIRQRRQIPVAKVPINSLLWYVFDSLENTDGYENEWEGIPVKKLQELQKELNKLMDDLSHNSQITPNTKLIGDMSGDDDRNDTEIPLAISEMESIGEWKTRILKLQNEYANDPESLKLIHEQKEKLYNRPEK